MSPTDHLIPPRERTATRSLDAARRRRRLEHLLDLRARLAVLAVERAAHGLDDALDTLGQQLAVEHALDVEFPDVYAERLDEWVRQDAEREHDPDRLEPSCGICQAIAQRSGINLTPPEAA